MVLSLVKPEPECRRSKEVRKAIPAVSIRRDTEGPGGVIDLRHAAEPAKTIQPSSTMIRIRIPE